MNKYIKTPYPNESVEDAPWHKCTTWYELNVLWSKHNKKKGGLPTKEE